MIFHTRCGRRSFVAGTLLLPLARAQNGFDLAQFERQRVVDAATRYMRESPVTITESRSPRSAGGPHDFFSEGDYWWPDPANPDGPYVQKDGMSNPANFTSHRKALMRLSVQMPALAAAYKITRVKKYGEKAASHLRAWFVDASTRMNPNLQYAQAIHGRSTGRGTGIIDTIHLVEVAQAFSAIEESGALSRSDSSAIKQWFSAYTRWMNESDNGKQERDAKNNHGTCWTMQVAAFAKLTGDRKMLEFTADRFRNLHIPGQEAQDGSFPLELARTKPYGYSIFNLEAMSTLAQIHRLWHFMLPDGRGVGKAVEFLAPFIADKKKWPKPPDVMYFDQWPMRQSFLLFGGLALNRPQWIELWKTLPADSNTEEIVRNFFIRQPVLWVD